MLQNAKGNKDKKSDLENDLAKAAMLDEMDDDDEDDDNEVNDDEEDSSSDSG